jgi:hypothetical protein
VVAQFAVVPTREGRARYAEALTRCREHVNCGLAEVRTPGYEARFGRTGNADLALCEAGLALDALRDAQLLLRRRGTE